MIIKSQLRLLEHKRMYSTVPLQLDMWNEMNPYETEFHGREIGFIIMKLIFMAVKSLCKGTRQN